MKLWSNFVTSSIINCECDEWFKIIILKRQLRGIYLCHGGLYKPWWMELKEHTHFEQILMDGWMNSEESDEVTA